LLWVGVILAIPCVFTILYPWIGEWTAYVPNQRDERLVGQWSETEISHGARMTTITVLRLDGAGETTVNGKRRARFKWGTRGDVLYAKYMSVDAWQNPFCRYSFVDQGTTVKFESTRYLGIVRPLMRRAR
jgi:hypothetical protein